MTPQEKQYYHADPAFGSSMFGAFDKHGRSYRLVPGPKGDFLDVGVYYECLFEATVSGDNSLLAPFVVINLQGAKPDNFDLILAEKQLAPGSYLAYTDKEGKVRQRMRNTAKGAPNKTNKNLFYWFDYYCERGHLEDKILIPKNDADMCRALVNQTLEIPIELPGLGEPLHEVIEYANKVRFQEPYFWQMPVVGWTFPVKALVDFELWFDNQVLLADLKTTAAFAEFDRAYRRERWHQGALYPEVVKGNDIELFADGMLYLIAEKKALGEPDNPVYRTKAKWLGHDPAKVERLKELASDHIQWQFEGGKDETHMGWEEARLWRSNASS